MGGNGLVEQIKVSTQQGLDVSTLVWELIENVQETGDAGPLRDLLLSSDERVTQSGLFVASEIGEAGQRYANLLPRFLSHQNWKIRGLAVDCTSLWSGSADEQVIGLAMLLINDSEPGVQNRVMHFICQASPALLRSGYDFLRSSERPNAKQTSDCIQQLIHLKPAEAERIIADLSSHDAIQRRFSAIAAARIADQTYYPLVRAQSLDDSTVSEFAQSRLEISAIQVHREFMRAVHSESP